MKKFRGEFNELRSIVAKTGYDGEWTEQDDKQVFRTEDGPILNWWPKTGTLNVQGKKVAGDKFEKAIEGSFDGTVRIATVAAEAPHESESRNRDLTNSSGIETKRVFVVYGHDADACDQLELLLLRLKLDPFVLGNTGGGGLTIIEALEKEITHRSTGNRFGIVLLTPDDLGYESGDDATNAEPRARQNVVMEMGMLLAAFGRKRVAILKKGHVVEPTDIGGIIYLPFNDHVKETAARLCQRLTEAGFELDAESIAAASA